MSSRLKTLLLAAAERDGMARHDSSGWQTRCLHCRSTVGLTVDGTPWPGTTLEHIVPRSWFGKRQAAPLIAQVGAADDPRNLALACARCNHEKGRGPDAEGPSVQRAYDIIAKLLAARTARWREPAVRA